MLKLTHDEISVNRETKETVHQADKLPVYVILDNIRSSYNVGSIFRTSDGALVKKIYLCGYTPHPPDKALHKTALGALDSIEWEYVNDPLEVVLKLKSEGVKISALELTKDTRMYHQVESGEFPLALIVGNEITGVSQRLLDECDFSLEIPQYGIKQSLNVAVAYGISIFELRKIWDKNS